MNMTCAIHVIVIESSVVEEGILHIIYDHNTHNLHYSTVHVHPVAFCLVTQHRTHPLWQTAMSDMLWSHQQPLAKFNTTGDLNSLGNYY